MEEKKKIKILVHYDDYSGVSRYRSIWPHAYMQQHYGDEFDIDMMMLKDFPKDNLVDFLQQYDILVFHKQLDQSSKILELTKFLSKPVTVMDIDDHFKLGPQHPMYMSSVKGKWPEIIVDHLRKSDYVTTTTPIFANLLKKYNKEVYVLPNCIDKEFMPQFNVTKQPDPNGRIRFGLICGSTHQKDIELMQGLTNFPKEIMDKLCYSLHGFDTNGFVSVFNKQTGEVNRRKIEPHESVWNIYERHMTNNYSTISPEHKEFLLKYEKVPDMFGNNEPYSRNWTLDINEYAKHYEKVDVLLAPLYANDFNLVKSALKVAECAYTDTAIIASDFGPYSELTSYLEKGGKVNPNGNAILIDPQKNHKQWAKAVKYVVEHPECVKIMADNLKRDFVEKYSLERVTKDRVELYRKIYAAKYDNV